MAVDGSVTPASTPASLTRSAFYTHAHKMYWWGIRWYSTTTSGTYNLGGYFGDISGKWWELAGGFVVTGGLAGLATLGIGVGIGAIGSGYSGIVAAEFGRVSNAVNTLVSEGKAKHGVNADINHVIGVYSVSKKKKKYNEKKYFSFNHFFYNSLDLFYYF
jgi:hypothetical protein